MKLSVWAKKQGISYITAWRWFNEGRLPVKAYRSDSGTIIVQDESESSEQVMGNNQSNDVMSMVLKKTVEFSKNNGTVEDFAAWVLSTFSLKLNTSSDSPKYSRVKPKAEDIRKHFQQFIRRGEKPKSTSFVANEETLNEIVKSDGLGDDARLAATLEVTNEPSFSESVDTEQLKNSLAECFVAPTAATFNNSMTYPSAGGVVTRSVDSTPQLNYTGSNNAALGSNLTSGFLSLNDSQPASQYYGADAHVLTSNTVTASPNNGTLYFSRTQEPLDTDGYKVMMPERARRGRKPAKSFRK